MKTHIQLSDHFTYGKLLRFTLPSIAMMIVTSIYSVVDGFFVSNFAGKTPFAAVNLVMPVLMILGAVGFMLGTGGTALVAKTCGEGDKDRANRYFSLFVYTALIVGLVLAVLGALFIRPIAAALGAEGELLDNCMVYGRTVLVALPFFMLQTMFQSFFVAAEKPQLGLAMTAASGATNMILDALLVGLLPQEYKLMGAALATATAQTIGGVIPLVYFSRENTSLLRLGKTKYDGQALARACVNGSSEFMSNISMSLVGMLYNLQLMKFAGENGVAAYGVMMYVSMIFAGAFMGYSIGTAPIVGYHYGAQNMDELKNLRRRGMTVVGIGGVGMLAAAQLMAVPLARVFVGYDPQLFQLTVSGFRIFSLSFAFMGFSIFTSGFFTALNDGVTSAIISFLRTLVFEAASVMLLPLILKMTGVWLSVVVAEFMAFILGLAFLHWKRNAYQY